jgi:transposase
LEPTAFLDSTRDALRHIIERAGARGKARKEPSLLPRIGMANDAVDNVRRGEPTRLLKDGDDRLKGSKYFWLTSLENHSKKQHARFLSICNPTLATGRAWSYKESCAISGPRRRRGMKKLARSLKERIDNIVTYGTHGITNAVAEGINSKIMSMKRRAGGYRNIENFKAAVLFYCGGLDLDPR